MLPYLSPEILQNRYLYFLYCYQRTILNKAARIILSNILCDSDAWNPSSKFTCGIKSTPMSPRLWLSFGHLFMSPLHVLRHSGGHNLGYTLTGHIQNCKILDSLGLQLEKEKACMSGHIWWTVRDVNGSLEFCWQRTQQYVAKVQTFLYISGQLSGWNQKSLC